MNFLRRNIGYREPVAAVLLSLFLSLWCGTNLFYHTHSLGEEKISHSHPYSNSHHTHSGAEFEIIASASHQDIVAESDAADFLCEKGEAVKIAISQDGPDSIFCGSQSLFRGPPAVC